MELKEAVATAKGFLMDLFADERAYDPMLEEVEHDADQRLWRVTISFQRQMAPEVGGIAGAAAHYDGLAGLVRSFQRTNKVVTISDDDCQVVAVKSRESMG